ncbi:MAG TPA: tRNA (guanosine(46)-N7)-methyltransferase TrmB [Opitutaceae bacterium]|nr:tRNA (guanosine(46)-N7)-methyltransferase TrmB [Opitutaceae bacterium]
MRFHPGAKPEFVHHVESRLATLRDELLRLFSGCAGPAVLEIGCGHGHFLSRYAHENPGHFCVGIDLLKDRLERAAKKRDRAKLANLHFVKTEAAEFLECLPREISFRSVFLLFPDPWPKKRHHKNRLVRADFMAALAARMAPGGQFYFRTDHAEYFEAGRAVLANHPAWQIEPDVAWPCDEATVFQLKADAYHSLTATVRTHGQLTS